MPASVLILSGDAASHFIRSPMNHHPSRRRFLKTSAAAGLALWAAPAAIRAAGANEKLNIGVIGVINRGGENLKGVSGENIVALCDVDDRLLGPVAAKYP